MTDDRILLHTSTSLLRACTRLLPFHLLLAALGGWHAHGLWAAIAWTLITLSLAWLHWRIAFDAAIFRRWLAVPDSRRFRPRPAHPATAPSAPPPAHLARALPGRDTPLPPTAADDAGAGGHHRGAA